MKGEDMAQIGENYAENLVNVVAKKIVEKFENLTIEDVNMYQIGYNKAIDELLNYAETHSFYIRDRAEEIPVVSISMLKVLAAQMKGGAE